MTVGDEEGESDGAEVFGADEGAAEGMLVGVVVVGARVGASVAADGAAVGLATPGRHGHTAKLVSVQTRCLAIGPMAYSPESYGSPHLSGSTAVMLPSSQH